MISTLRTVLKNLLAQNRVKEVFRRMRMEMVDENSELYNELIVVESSWNEAQKQGKLSLIRLEDKNINFNSINQALIWLIDRMEVADLKRRLKNQQEKHRAIPPTHAFTCNRHDQYESFLLAQYEQPEGLEILHDGKVQFYYLYGDVRQDLPALFNRLRLEVGGYLENWQKEDYDPGIKTIPVAFKPHNLRNLKIAKIDLRKKLLSHFLEPLNQQKPLLERKLPDLLPSPSLDGYGPDDYVFILITLDDHNWNPTISPEIVRHLYTDFCNCHLPESSPHFFFFFGIVYQKENKKVKKEVKAAIEQAKYGMALEELGPVKLEDISEWLSRYPILLPDGQDPRKFAKAYFKEEKLFDMADVTPKLRYLIDQYNKGIIINPEQNSL